jgi:NAD-dependent dihydropyrimidine dehydrogenase PreA subunit
MKYTKLSRWAVEEASRVTYAVADSCPDVKDRGCLEECTVDCVYEGPWAAYISPDERIDCGLWGHICPTDAIYFEADLPERCTAYAGADADFFTVITTPGQPGGASTVGAQPVGHALIAAGDLGAQ